MKTVSFKWLTLFVSWVWDFAHNAVYQELLYFERHVSRTAFVVVFLRQRCDSNRQINAHYVAISHLRVIWFLVCTILLQFLCVCVKIFNWSFSCLQSNCVPGQFYILLHCIKMHNVIQYTLYCTHKCVYMYISFILFLDLVSGKLGEKVLFLSFSVEKVTPNLVLTRQKTTKRSQWHLPRGKAAWNFAMWASKWSTDNLNKPFMSCATRLVFKTIKNEKVTQMKLVIQNLTKFNSCIIIIKFS